MDSETDRPRGILSPADREFLLGQTEMTHEQSRRNAEARIRKRIRNGIEDFTLLAHTLSDKDRRGVFDSVDDSAFIDGLTAMLSLTYLGLKEQGADFEQILEPAIGKAEEVYAARSLGSAVDVSVELRVQTEYGTGVDETAERIRRGLPVSPEALFSVVMTGNPVIEDISSIIVQLPRDTESPEGIVQRLARYLDAEVHDQPLNRIELDIK